MPRMKRASRSPTPSRAARDERVGRAERGREGDLDGGLEDLFLGAEVVVDQGRVHAGGLGDAADEVLS